MVQNKFFFSDFIFQYICSSRIVVVTSAWTLSWRWTQPYRNQTYDLPCKSMEWFTYERDLRYERVNKWGGQEIIYQLWKIKVFILTKALILNYLGDTIVISNRYQLFRKVANCSKQKRPFKGVLWTKFTDRYLIRKESLSQLFFCELFVSLQNTFHSRYFHLSVQSVSHWWESYWTA